MVLSISIFIGSLFLIKFTTINLFPYVDKDFLYVDVYSEVLGDIEATEMLVDEVVDTLKEEECIKDISVSIGRALPRFYITVSTYPPAEDFAQILFKIDLTKGNYESREVLAYELEKKINKRVARGKAFVKLVELNEPGPDIRVKLLGTNRSQTEEVAKEVEGILRSFNSTKNISSDVTPSHYGYHIEIDEDRASMLGLTKYDVQRQVNIALYGANSTIFRKEGNDIDVILKTDISSIADLENLKNIFSIYQ
jgi:multidrug efflux pump subunit AcrB